MVLKPSLFEAPLQAALPLESPAAQLLGHDGESDWVVTKNNTRWMHRNIAFDKGASVDVE